MIARYRKPDLRASRFWMGGSWNAVLALMPGKRDRGLYL
jgi:hypothetical protein